jgi:hypothetical protein
MLSIINAAEAQFRHDTEARMRDHALLISIGERRAAVDGRARSASAPRAVAPIAAATRAPRQAWARPIGIKNCDTAVCATA